MYAISIQRYVPWAKLLEQGNGTGWGTFPQWMLNMISDGLFFVKASVDDENYVRFRFYSHHFPEPDSGAAWNQLYWVYSKSDLAWCPSACSDTDGREEGKRVW